MFKSQLEPPSENFHETQVFVENIFDTVKKAREAKAARSLAESKLATYDYSFDFSPSKRKKTRKNSKSKKTKSAKTTPKKKPRKNAKPMKDGSSEKKKKATPTKTPRKYTKRVNKVKPQNDIDDEEAAFILSSISQRSFDSFYNRFNGSSIQIPLETTTSPPSTTFKPPTPKISTQNSAYHVLLDHNYWIPEPEVKPIIVEPEVKIETVNLKAPTIEAMPSSTVVKPLEVNNNKLPPLDVNCETPKCDNAVKKRWLRQATSENTSPVLAVTPPETSPNDLKGPLKKRRLEYWADQQQKDEINVKTESDQMKVDEVLNLVKRNDSFKMNEMIKSEELEQIVDLSNVNRVVRSSIIVDGRNYANGCIKSEPSPVKVEVASPSFVNSMEIGRYTIENVRNPSENAKYTVEYHKSPVESTAKYSVEAIRYNKVEPLRNVLEVVKTPIKTPVKALNFDNIPTNAQNTSILAQSLTTTPALPYDPKASFFGLLPTAYNPATINFDPKLINFEQTTTKIARKPSICEPVIFGQQSELLKSPQYQLADVNREISINHVNDAQQNHSIHNDIIIPSNPLIPANIASQMTPIVKKVKQSPKKKEKKPPKVTAKTKAKVSKAKQVKTKKPPKVKQPKISKAKQKKAEKKQNEKLKKAAMNLLKPLEVVENFLSKIEDPIKSSVKIEEVEQKVEIKVEEVKFDEKIFEDVEKKFIQQNSTETLIKLNGEIKVEETEEVEKMLSDLEAVDSCKEASYSSGSEVEDLEEEEKIENLEEVAKDDKIEEIEDSKVEEVEEPPSLDLEQPQSSISPPPKSQVEELYDNLEPPNIDEPLESTQNHTESSYDQDHPKFFDAKCEKITNDDEYSLDSIKSFDSLEFKSPKEEKADPVVSQVASILEKVIPKTLKVEHPDSHDESVDDEEDLQYRECVDEFHKETLEKLMLANKRFCNNSIIQNPFKSDEGYRSRFDKPFKASLSFDAQQYQPPPHLNRSISEYSDPRKDRWSNGIYESRRESYGSFHYDKIHHRENMTTTYSMYRAQKATQGDQRWGSNQVWTPQEPPKIISTPVINTPRVVPAEIVRSIATVVEIPGIPSVPVVTPTTPVADPFCGFLKDILTTSAVILPKTKTASSDPRLNPSLVVDSKKDEPATPKKKLSLEQYRKRQSLTSITPTPTSDDSLSPTSSITTSSLPPAFDPSIAAAAATG